MSSGDNGALPHNGETFAPEPASSSAQFSASDVERLLRMVRLHPDKSEAEARKWLKSALEMIPSILDAKKAKRPQRERNDRLEALAAGAKAVRIAFGKLDPATRAALYEASRKINHDDDLGPLLYLRGEDEDETDLRVEHGLMPVLLRPETEVMDRLFAALERHAVAAQRRALSGRPTNEGTDEVVKLLAGFVDRFGAKKPSVKDGGPFHRFLREACRMATNENLDLLGSVRRVLSSRRGGRN